MGGARRGGEPTCKSSRAAGASAEETKGCSTAAAPSAASAALACAAALPAAPASAPSAAAAASEAGTELAAPWAMAARSEVKD